MRDTLVNSNQNKVHSIVKRKIKQSVTMTEKWSLVKDY